MYKPIKPKNKIFRVLFQLAVIIAAIAWVAWIAIERGSPREQRKDEWMQRRGFLALSYGALSRTDKGVNMPRTLLTEHLEALAAAGYEAITVDDVVDFYEKGSLLPDKAVFIMFEGGRRDSAVYGQEGLVKSGMRATMFLYTGLLGAWDRTFLTRSQLSALGRSRFWDVGSLGHTLYLPREGDAEEERKYFLTAYAPGETGEGFAVRAAGDYDESSGIIEKVVKKKPQARVFMPANTLGGSMDPVLADINRRLIAGHYKIAFTREGVAFNQQRDNPLELSRLRIPADCGVEELFNRISLWLPATAPYSYAQDKAAEQWLREYGEIEFLPEALRLESRDGAPAMAWLLGSEGWRNLTASVDIVPSEAEQSMYLRFASRQSFIKLTSAEGKLRVYERIPGYGLTRLLEKDLPAGKPAKISVLLRNNRLGVQVDGKPLTDYLIPVIVSEPGRLAFETIDGAAPDKGGDGASSSSFGGVTAQPLPSRWRIDDAFTNDMNVSGLLFVPGSVDVKTILDAANMGFDRYALLPAGEFSLAAMEKGLEDVPGGVGRRLWTGVVFTPEVGGNETWARLARASEDAKRYGRKTAFRLNRTLAEELSGVEQPPPADMLVLENSEDLPRRTMAALYRKYPAILYGSGDAYEEKTP